MPRYGPAFKVLLGGWEIVVVSSGDAISFIFSACPGLLRNDLMHHEMFHVVAGVRTNYVRLHDIMIHKLFPLVDKGLSRRSLGQTAQPFARVLFSQVKKVTQTHDLRAVSLMQLVQEPLYIATNIALFGSSFPLDTYKDFHSLDKSVPYRFSRLPFWSWPSSCARERLLTQIKGYLQRGEVADCDDRFALAFMEVFKANDIQVSDGSRLVLTFLWGLHSNTMSTSFWLLAYLLNDPDALARVRAEIDTAVDGKGGKFTDLETLLASDPDELDDPCFAILTSAIMETMRLTALHAAVRLAECDFDLKQGDKTIPIKKGEYVWGNVRAAHMDETIYPCADKFVVDRFADHPYRKGQMQTAGKPFLSLGGGRHICKGRWLAIYEIKVAVIILLRLFDISPVEKSPKWTLPRVSKHSIGVIHTQDEVFVQLCLRQHGGILDEGDKSCGTRT
ncbi:cytochrome P450 [Paxillus ammoniavirescens]|nr:cytochrome P450 [Paxillus ammoniavirescens]